MIELTKLTTLTPENLHNQAKVSWQALMARSDVSFYRLPHQDPIWQMSSEYGENLAKNYQRLVVVGMGGSSLGARAIWEAVTTRGTEPSHGSGKEILFFDNIDALAFSQRLERMAALESTHWLFVTKSGTTVETLAMINFAAQALAARGIDICQHATVVADKKDSPLVVWGRENNLPFVEIPGTVGGRFSVLTPVGLIPAAFAGVDCQEIRAGALWALGQKDLVCELSAQTLESFARGEWITLLWAYSDQLSAFGLWWQQLWAESLGKSRDRTGKPAPRSSSPFYCIGPRDQHSILQQIADGAKDKFIWFLRVNEAEDFGPSLGQSLFPSQKYLEGRNLGHLLRAQAMATQEALTQQAVHSLTLTLPRVDAAGLGALFLLMELVVGVLGEALNINAFDQPGVEAGKKLTLEILNK